MKGHGMNKTSKLGTIVLAVVIVLTALLILEVRHNASRAQILL
jgi:hypothetical protein